MNMKSFVVMWLFALLETLIGSAFLAVFVRQVLSYVPAPQTFGFTDAISLYMIYLVYSIVHILFTSSRRQATALLEDKSEDK